MRRSRIRLALAALSVLALILAGSISLVFLVFNSPSMLNRFAAALEPVAGYRVEVDDISLSAALAGEVDNLRITKRGERAPLASFDSVEFKVNPRPAAEAVVEKIVLDHPKFRFVLKPDGKETDWSGLDRLPPVRLLQIKEGEIDISGEAYRILATHLNVAIDNFSTHKGGRARVTSALAVNGINEAMKGAVKANGEGTVSADIRLTSLFPTIAGKGELSVKLKSGAFSGWSFEDAALDAPLALDSKRFSFEKTALRIGSLEYKGDGDRAAVRDVVLRGSGWFDRRSSMLSVANISGNLPDAGEFAGSGTARLSGSFPWKASFSSTSVNFGRIFALTNPLLPEDYRKWGIQGRGDLVAELEKGWLNEEAGFSGALKLTMRDAGFTSADKTKAAAGLTGEIILRLGPPGKRGDGFKGRVEMKGGEFLWGAYYKDFKGEKLWLSSEGTFSFGHNGFLDCSGEIDFYQTGDYRYRTSLKDGSSWFRATAGKLSINRLYTLLLRDHLNEDSGLSGLEVSGASDIELSLSRNVDGETAVAGRVKTAGVSLSLPKSKLALEGLNIDLPFDLSFDGRPNEGKGSRETGHIGLKRLQRGDIIIEHVYLPIAAARNRFETLREIDAELFGGRVRVGAVRVKDVFMPSAEVATRITAERLDLSKLLGVALQGVLDADLGEVSLAQGKWTSSGKIRAQAFGGVVEARNLSGSDLPASSRMIGGDITFAGLDLEQMTNLTKTGRVTGFIKGSIMDFSMTYGEPSSFVLKLESDKGKSSSKMISVDAIESLSIIGTGSSGISAVLNSGINRFFKAYPYSRIGIMCTLKNDVFRLRGTIHEGNTEYLIRKGLFRGIDVINQNPDNAISFRDMQERIGRIFKSEKPEVS